MGGRKHSDVIQQNCSRRGPFEEGNTNKKAKEALDSHIIVTVYKKDTIGSVLEQIKRILKL